jgi:hypothetical protein
MERLGNRDVEEFITDLASRYDAYSRNKVRSVKTGEEAIIPVSENARVREELHCTIDELCAFYLGASEGERDHIRTLIQAHRPLHNGLLSHIGWAAQHKPPDWLRRGLAAASIEDNRLDSRDMFIALGALYLVAIQAGLDASCYFQEAAQWSSSVAGPYFKRPMRDFLSDFEQSAYFRESIQPKLRRQ